MYRLFVAIPLPATVKQQLAMLQGGIPGARWVSPEHYHLTLRFIGEVDGHQMSDIRSALDDVHLDPFTLRLEGVSAFTNRGKAHTIWVGVPRCQALMDLQKRVDTALRQTGAPPERRKYTPHITLARLRGAPGERVTRFLAAHALFATPSFDAQCFRLYLSRLGHSGPVHTVIASYPHDDADTQLDLDDSAFIDEEYEDEAFDLE